MGSTMTPVQPINLRGRSDMENHVSRSATITLNDTPDKILPLFTAYGETLWITGWEPAYVYPEDGEAKTGSVWKTRHGDAETVWITINYDMEAHAVTYVNVTPDRQVTRIDIQCDARGETKTSARITYTVTALGEKGIEYIQHLTQAHYNHWMHSWEKAVNHYLQHGEASSL